jgi:hypothetical protein
MYDISVLSNTTLQGVCLDVCDATATETAVNANSVTWQGAPEGLASWGSSFSTLAWDLSTHCRKRKAWPDQGSNPGPP